MRPTTVIGLLGLIVVGVIAADVLIHPTGVNAAGKAVNTFWSTSTAALLGNGQKSQ
jgi:hypothetical protein